MDSLLEQADRADFLSLSGAEAPFARDMLQPNGWVTPQNITYMAEPTEARAKTTMLVQTTTPTPYGLMLSVFSEQGLVYTGFQTQEGGWHRAMSQLRHHFPDADVLTSDSSSAVLSAFFEGKGKLTLHMFGTAFQHKVWQALLEIPTGKVTTYGTVAERIGEAAAVRAVGTAVGANPVSLIVPCHRVIHSDGENKNYGWGVPRKALMLALEQQPHLTAKDISRKVA